MNLSELIVSSNPALKNILALAASHEKRTLVEDRPGKQQQGRLLLRESVRGSNVFDMNQSSIVVDNSLIKYLDEMNYDSNPRIRQIKRTSIDTAEFVNTQ